MGVLKLWELEFKKFLDFGVWCESPGFMFLLSEGVVVLKKLILTLSTLGRWGSLKRTDINSFYFGNVWQS